MSYTAKPQFTGLGSNVNAGQSQQQSGQPKPHADVPLHSFPQATPVPNPPVGNTNVTTHPIVNPGSVTMTPMNRQQLQQQQQQFATIHQQLYNYSTLHQLQSLGVNAEPLGKVLLNVFEYRYLTY